MTRVDVASQLASLAAAIRRQTSAARPAPASATKTGMSTALAPPAHRSEPKGALATAGEAALSVALRVRSIDPDDPGRERKAFRMFLDAVLLAEFGEQLINDAGFYQLVEQVQQHMEADPDLAASIHDAATMLLGTAQK